MDLRSLPTEIIKFILSFLNDKDARASRLVNTHWLRWIKYDKFDIYFATSTLLPQIIDRLSTYQYPIELSLHKSIQVSVKSIRLSERDILEHLPRLTQLKAFNFLDYSHVVTVEPQEYFKLSTLTNLEKLRFGYRHLPVELLRHFPRMKVWDNVVGSEELIQIVNAHCPFYHELEINDSLLSIAPVSLKELILTMSNATDNTSSLEALTRLTKLKTLEIVVENRSSSVIVDLQHITWLNKFSINSSDVRGLEYSHHLTELNISEKRDRDTSTLLDSLKTLPTLQKLGLFLLNNGFVTLSNLSHLTHLWLCQFAINVDLKALPTTLIDLDAEFKTEAFELSDISHLVHLTKLTTRYCITTAIESLHALTKMKELHLNMDSSCHISLSTLGNLTYIHSPDIAMDPQTIKCLTNLQYLTLFTPPTEQATIDNLHYLSHLTHLSFCFRNELEHVSFDYKVIEKLPLANLKVQMSQVKNCWTVLPTVTTLESLTIEFVEDEENIASLTVLGKLTKLEVMQVADKVTCVHVTRLTNLQELGIRFKNGFSFSELLLKLTRLQSVTGIKMEET